MGYVVVLLGLAASFGVCLLGNLAGSALSGPPEAFVIVMCVLGAVGGFDAFTDEDERGGLLGVLGLPLAVALACFASGILYSLA